VTAMSHVFSGDGDSRSHRDGRFVGYDSLTSDEGGPSKRMEKGSIFGDGCRKRIGKID